MKGFIERVITIFRDAITGKFVSKDYAKSNPTTTTKEKRKVYRAEKSEEKR